MLKALVLTPQQKDSASRLYRSLVVETLGDLKVELLNPIPGRPPKKGKLFEVPLFPDLSFRQEADLLKKADLVIADLTSADFKAGFVISEALKMGLPVLGLFWNEVKPERVAQWQTSAEQSDLWRKQADFYIEGATKDNIRSVLRRFLRHLKHQRQSWGKLVVFDGTDGSGKTTQINLLKKYLTKKKIPFKTLDFPRYKTNFYGQIIRKFLDGEYGPFDQIDPHLAAILYANDRLFARNQIFDWLKAGNLVIADRYASASLGHQTAKLPESDQEEFIDWLLELEYRVNRLPKEDLMVFFQMPVSLSQKLQKKKDEAEKDTDHQIKTQQVFAKLAKRFDHWYTINCVDKNKKILPPEEIHQEVVDLLTRKKIIEN